MPCANGADTAGKCTCAPCVEILFKLCRFRNAHPACNGTFSPLDTIADICELVRFVPTELAKATGADAPLAQALPEPGRHYEGRGRRRRLRAGGGRRDSEGGNFLTDIVGASIDILDSVDALDQDIDWCATCHFALSRAVIDGNGD